MVSRHMARENLLILRQHLTIRVQSTVFLTSRPLMPGRIVGLCESSGITVSLIIMEMTMARLEGQVPALRAPNLVDAA